MSESPVRDEAWLIELLPGAALLRCSYQRRGKKVERFTVQLECWLAGAWHSVVRYDNAHGFCHRDTLHPDGSQEKAATNVGDENQTFTYAIEELRGNWRMHRDRFLKELAP